MSRRKPTFSDAADEGWGTPSHRLEEADLDITPMIDVTFLLLIFFMVTSTMQAEQDVDVPAARHGVGVEAQGATIINIKAPSRAGAEEPVIEMADGRQVTLDDVRTEVEQARDQFRTDVIIKADREVPFGFVRQVIKVVSSVDGVEFHIGVKDKPSY